MACIRKINNKYWQLQYVNPITKKREYGSYRPGTPKKIIEAERTRIEEKISLHI